MKHCQFVNFDERLKHGIEDVMQIITMIPHLHGKFQVDVSLIDQLEEEFIVYQGMPNNEIPQRIWDVAAVFEKETTQFVIFNP